MIREQQRGRLKVYLGFAPGVGKTYEMLQEGQRLKRQGVDVVIGIVETHSRAETAAQIGDLEQVPRRRIEYRGVVLEEMDLDAVLARRPTVALVDELAHTNAPGSRNPKRYQEVEELLRGGIHVITTMNVQHLESLYDMIERFAGVKVKERVPDYVLAQADQIVNVDLPAEDLQERLRGGKVYPADRVERALANFFTGDNLSRLRELALEEIASALDQQPAGEARRAGRQRLRPDHGVPQLAQPERPPPAAQGGAAGRPLQRPVVRRLLPDAGRADGTGGRGDAAEGERLPGPRRSSSAASPCRSRGRALRGGRGRLASRKYRITHILLGRSQRPWYQRWFGRTALDRLLQAVPLVDITVVDVR